MSLSPNPVGHKEVPTSLSGTGHFVPMKSESGSMPLFGALPWPGQKGKQREIKNADPKNALLTPTKFWQHEPGPTFSPIKRGYITPEHSCGY